MMMEKTAEEMRIAVLAYCEEVCPDSRYKSLNPLGLTRIPDEKMHGYNLDGVDVAWVIMYRGDVVCFLYEGTSADLIDFAHRLFGLQARDAVQALRNESDVYFEQLKAERAKVAELQDLLKSSKFAHEVQMQECATMVSSERNRAAALVKALEFVKQRCEELETGCEPVYEIVKGKEGARLKGQFTVIAGSDYEVVCNALEAHKKGATT